MTARRDGRSAKAQKFLVTHCPPWYRRAECKYTFACKRTQGLFRAVAELLLRKHGSLSDEEKRFATDNVLRIVRDNAILEMATIQQEPSLHLLLVLMDLVDIEAGNDLESILGLDRAGVKHVLLAHRNYTAFHVPRKEMQRGSKRRVIPVVTQYSNTHNLFFHDSTRSMIGTYTVAMPDTPAQQSYFLQEVIYVPGHESLTLLKAITGDRYDFWDMCLEVPTHTTGLTPCFQLIEPSRILRESGQGERDAESPSDVRPMCCVLDPASAAESRRKRDANVDYFTEGQLNCDLTEFCCLDGQPRTVYLRKSGSLVGGKRVHLTSVVALRDGQDCANTLYASTTLRFYRAVKRSSVKGSGERVSCWTELLKDLVKDTYLTVPDVYQEVLNTALAAYMKRVCPENWCAVMPRHIVRTIGDPTMIQVAELAVKLMDSKIPKAFAVAELLYCPTEKVKRCAKAWLKYHSDPQFQIKVKEMRKRAVDKLIGEDWAALTEAITCYVHQRHGPRSAKLSEFAQCFKKMTLKNSTKLQKLWHTLVRGDVAKGFAQLRAKVKVLLLKLRTYYFAAKRKRVRTGRAVSSGSEGGDRDKAPGDSSEPSGGQEKLCFAMELEPSPVTPWIKNLSTLLLCAPWLFDPEDVRRNAVCALLGLEDTVLHKRNEGLLRHWVTRNRTTVEILGMHGLRDRLSKALLDCLTSNSARAWSVNVARALTVRSPGRVGRASSEKRARGSLSARAGKNAPSRAYEEEPPRRAKETGTSEDECARGGEEYERTEEHHCEEERTDDGPEPAYGSEKTSADAFELLALTKRTKKGACEGPAKRRGSGDREENPARRKRTRKDKGHECRASDSEDQSGSQKTRRELSEPTVGEPDSAEDKVEEDDRSTGSTRLAKTGGRREKHASPRDSADGDVSLGSGDELHESPRRGKLSWAPNPQEGTGSRSVGRLSAEPSARGESAADSDSHREAARPGNRGRGDERSSPTAERRGERGERKDKPFPPGRLAQSRRAPQDTAYGSGSSSAEDQDAEYVKYKGASLRRARSKEGRRRKEKNRRRRHERSPDVEIKRWAGTTQTGLKGRSEQSTEQKDKDTLSKRSSKSSGEEYGRGDPEEVSKTSGSVTEGPRSEPSSESSGEEDGKAESETCRGRVERGHSEQAIERSQKGAQGDLETAGPSGGARAEKGRRLSGYAPGLTDVEYESTESM